VSDPTRDERVDRRLRRASDDVLATVARTATPPPLDRFDGRHPGRLVATCATALLVVVGLVTLRVSTGDHRTATTASTAAAASSVEARAGRPATEVGLCPLVADAAAFLATEPVDATSWVAVGADVEAIGALVESADLPDGRRRSYDRFIDLARHAVELGSSGGAYPARVPAEKAVVVARRLAAAAGVDGCVVDARRRPGSGVLTTDFEERP
jgi:hypothetical protein